MKRYIKSAWSGVFQPRAIIKEFEVSKDDAKLLSDYWWQTNADSGFKTQTEALKWLSGYVDIQDQISKAEAYFEKHPEERS